MTPEYVVATQPPRVALGELTDITSGVTKGRRTKEALTDVPFLRAGNLGAGDLDLSEVKTIPATAREVEKYRLESGDVLMVEGSGSAQRLGQGWLWEGQVETCLHQNHVFRARPDKARVLPEYLAWYLQSPDARKYFRSVAKTTSGLNTVNKKQVSALPVPLPSLDEQRLVVSTVEQLSQMVDDAVRYFTAALTGAAQMRNALTHACWSSANTARLEDLLASPMKNGRSVRTADDGFPVLRLTALREGVVDTREAKVGEWTAEQARPFLIERDDFLVSRGNGTLNRVGRGGLVLPEPPPVAFPDTLIRVRVDQSRMTGRFLRLVWDSPRVRVQIEERAHTSAGIYKVNQDMLRDIELPVPSVEEQVRMTSEVEGHMAAVRSTEASLQAQLAQARELTRAVLHSAFDGARDTTEAAGMTRISEPKGAHAVLVAV